MTAVATPPVPDATRCPACRAPLAGPSACAACGLRLTGPDAVRLWELDCALLALDAQRGRLLSERTAVLARLRPDGAPAPATVPVPVPGQAPVRVLAPRAEWTPQRVQNLLLALGGLLLAVAALVFAAVTYDRLGAAGRSLVLVVLTVAAGAAAPRLRSRGLQATAEALGGLALVLAALDAYGLRTLGLADDSSALSYAAGSAAVLAVLAAAYARAVPLRLLQAAAVAVAQLPAVLLLARYDAAPATAALVLAGLATVDLAVLRLLPVLPHAARATLAAAAGGTVGVALLLAAVAPRDAAAATALVACAAVLGLAGTAVTDRTGRALLTGAVVPVLGSAAWTLADHASRPLVLAAVGLVAVLAAAQLPRAERLGPVVGALLVSAAGLAAVVEDALRGLLLPVTWLGAPWTLPAGRGLRGALAPGDAWTGTLAVPVVLLAAALSATAAAVALHRLRAAAVPVGVLVAATVVLLPLGLDLGFGGGLALLLVLAGALAAAGALVGRARSRTAGTALAATGTAVALLTAAWSTASQDATLAVLPLVTLGVAALAATRRGLPAATHGPGRAARDGDRRCRRRVAGAGDRPGRRTAPARRGRPARWRAAARRGAPGRQRRRGRRRRDGRRAADDRRRRLAVLGARGDRSARPGDRPAHRPPPGRTARCAAAVRVVLGAPARRRHHRPRAVRPAARRARPAARAPAPPAGAGDAVLGGVRPGAVARPAAQPARVLRRRGAHPAAAPGAGRPRGAARRRAVRPAGTARGRRCGPGRGRPAAARALRRGAPPLAVARRRRRAAGGGRRDVRAAAARDRPAAGPVRRAELTRTGQTGAVTRADLAPADEETPGWRDLTVWRTRSGRLLVRVARALARLVGPHLAVLGLLAVAGVAVTALTATSAVIYDDVSEQDGVAGLDRPVLDAAVAARTPLLARVVTAYTDLGGPVWMPVLAVSAVAAMAIAWRRWTPVALMLVAAAGSLAMTAAGKAVVGRTRPPLVDAVPPYESSASFPSGHSLNAVVVAGVVAYLLVLHQRSARVRAATVTAAATFATTMGLSRVYLGHHWLTDVLVAWTLGLAWLTVVVAGHRLLLTVRRRGAS